MYYINCFFIYSILGFILENAVYFILGQHGDSGILYGPFTPIYGIGAILILIISKYIFEKLHLKKWIETMIVFVIVTVIITGLEQLGGILIDKLFHISLWDYSNLKFHMGPYIALEISLLWGILSIILIYIIKPLIDSIVIKLPKYITYILIAIFIFDVIFTFLNKSKL